MFTNCWFGLKFILFLSVARIISPCEVLNMARSRIPRYGYSATHESPLLFFVHVICIHFTLSFSLASSDVTTAMTLKHGWGIGKVVTSNQVDELFVRAYNTAATMLTLISAFKKCGLFIWHILKAIECTPNNNTEESLDINYFNEDSDGSLFKV